MNIQPSEIESVEEIGMLDEAPVKLVRTSGGLFLAVGKLKNKNQEEVLSAGSHSAVVKYNVEKSFRHYQPSMMKSEQESEVVSGMSELLSKSDRDSGFDVYAIKKSGGLTIMATKHNVEVFRLEAERTDDALVLHETMGSGISNPASVAGAMSTVAAREAIAQGYDSLEFRGQKYDAKEVAKVK